MRIVFAEARQNWQAFAYVMHLHENRYIKRAGVAGIRARAQMKTSPARHKIGIDLKELIYLGKLLEYSH
ncbi:hypothetical protein CRN78_20200 [Klebsiella aerogenes]|nr:hypothetical protein CRN78_20200 [Klebsiella aerogenes]